MQDLSAQFGDYVKEMIDTEIKQAVAEKVKAVAVTVNVKGLAEMTGMSTSKLYKDVIDQPEFLAIEKDLGTKRLFYADKVAHAWNTYLDRKGESGLKRLPESLRRPATLLKEG